MYKIVVRRNIRGAFAKLATNDAPGLLARMDENVHHRFPGRTALGGERTNREDVAAWFDRLFRLMPSLEFRIHTLVVEGWPWDLKVGVEWTNFGSLLDGSEYRNRGAHVIRVRRGRIVAFHAYLDDYEELTGALARLAADGLPEASADPIVSAH